MPNESSFDRPPIDPALPLEESSEPHDSPTLPAAAPGSSEFAIAAGSSVNSGTENSQTPANSTIKVEGPDIVDPDTADPDTADADSIETAPKRLARRDSFFEVAFVVLIALLLALLLKIYVAEAYMIRGHSMQPTFVDGERVMVQKVFYEIERGDVVIFASAADPTKDLIKRVVGLPGDEIRVSATGEVRVNGEKLEESYIRTSEFASGREHQCVVRDGTYYVLGDNRPESQDSRYFDSVSSDLMKGKVVFRWWPLEDIETF